MMSPRPPPPPIFPRETSMSAVSESPRPIHAGTFNSNQLPPPMQSNASGYAAPRSYTGPILAPISIPTTSGGGGSAMQQQQQQQPAPQHIPLGQHSLGPSYPQQNQSDINHGIIRRVSTSYERLSERPPAFSSPASSSAYSSPASFSYDQRPDYGQSRRYSNEPPPETRSERSSLTAMIPSPTYTVHRNSEERYAEEQQYQSVPFNPTSIEESGSIRRDMPLNRSAGRYRIQVRQQPVAARACGFGERDRRVIDPPPIVQLISNDPNNHDTNELRYPFNVVHCTLYSVDGQTDETALTGMDKRLTRRLMGTLVSSPFVGVDEEGKDGCFFCFPDLSCRTHGKYRLRFVLMRLEPSELHPEVFTPIITETMSDIFTVYTAKEFPGMRPSTALTKALKRQGCAISVKKGNEKAIGPSGSGDDDEKTVTTPRTGNVSKKRRTGDK
ncbi:velvet factor-domain-containing protein [Peziza echinospora]|nr:velvet factor-domain-containing protein [Peziza echinospora]